MNSFAGIFKKSKKRRKSNGQDIDSTSSLLPVILPIKNIPGKFVFYCPGCQANHVINTNPKNGRPHHTLSGSCYKPTIRASVLSAGKRELNTPHCHSMITDGFISFFHDSSHFLSGRTVELQPLQ
ncbi:MAG: hypothetical protein INR73_17285 [Williamsia sp.]|nr:hypothetical protein [Williamsia sp.]